MDKNSDTSSGIINMLLGAGLFYAAVIGHSSHVTLPFMIVGGVAGACVFMYGLAKTLKARIG